VAPTYVDSEFGLNHALAPQTDLAVGIAGGGFADSYSEIRRGRFLERESFTGHDGEDMAYWKWQGTRLFYERQADGNPPLVLVYGVQHAARALYSSRNL
jgi:hypothetical protein